MNTSLRCHWHPTIIPWTCPEKISSKFHEHPCYYNLLYSLLMFIEMPLSHAQDVLSLHQNAPRWLVRWSAGALPTAGAASGATASRPVPRWRWRRNRGDVVRGWRCKGHGVMDYPLVICHIAIEQIEHGHRNSEFSHEKKVIFHSYVSLPEGTIMDY